MATFADTSGAQSISVDYDHLHHLAATLAGIARTLDGGGLYGVSVSEPFVAAAIAEVQHDWSRARAAIRQFLGDAAQAVDDAASGYAAAESSICGVRR